MSRRAVYRAIAAATGVLALAAITTPALVQARPTAHAATATVNVTAVDFKFRLSTSSAKKGKVIFKITNKGKLKHDFRIHGVTSKMISPGRSTSITVTFTKTGTYAYLCTVPGHAALGMKGKFKIT